MPAAIDGISKKTSPRTTINPVDDVLDGTVADVVISSAEFPVVGTVGGRLEKVDGTCVMVFGTCAIVVGIGVVIVCGTGGIGWTGGIDPAVFVGALKVCGGTPLMTNVLVVPVPIPPVTVMFGLSCVATGNEVKEGPVNASPRTPTGKSEVMNSNPENGPRRSGVPKNSSITNLEVC